MRTLASISTARSGACAAVTLPWRNRMSAICRPTGRIGLSAARGFWKMIATSRPRTSSSTFVSAASNASPPKTIFPAVTRAALADQGHGLAALERETNAIHRPHDATARAELDTEVLDREQRDDPTI